MESIRDLNPILKKYMPTHKIFLHLGAYTNLTFKISASYPSPERV